MTNLEKQYISATGDRSINNPDFNDFVTFRKIMGFQYRNLIINNLGSDVVELNKNNDDTIVYGSTFQTISEDPEIDKYYKYNNGLYVKVESIPKNYTLITHNPYDYRNIYDFNMYAGNGYNILFGMFGRKTDLDKNDKIYQLQLLRTLLQYSHINDDCHYSEDDNNYYSYVYTKR